MVHLSEIRRNSEMAWSTKTCGIRDHALGAGPPLTERRIALITTAGLHRKDDPPFALGSGDYRIIPSDADMDDLVMSTSRPISTARVSIATSTCRSPSIGCGSSRPKASSARSRAGTSPSWARHRLI